jgi:type I restriction enzyme S subunit
MKVKAVPSGWIQSEGRRLDVGPFLYGAVEARQRIRRLAAPKQRLKDLTAGPEGGIFNGPQFSRLWVTDPVHGVPFLGSSSMLLADLSHLPLLSRKYADSPKLPTSVPYCGPC